MTNIKAFPLHVVDTPHYNEGMDLRDYFASKAIGVLYAVYAQQGYMEYGQLAHHSYKIADAMMKAREQ